MRTRKHKIQRDKPTVCEAAVSLLSPAFRKPKKFSISFPNHLKLAKFLISPVVFSLASRNYWQGSRNLSSGSHLMVKKRSRNGFSRSDMVRKKSEPIKKGRDVWKFAKYLFGKKSAPWFTGSSGINLKKSTKNFTLSQFKNKINEGEIAFDSNFLGSKSCELKHENNLHRPTSIGSLEKNSKDRLWSNFSHAGSPSRNYSVDSYKMPSDDRRAWKLAPLPCSNNKYASAPSDALHRAKLEAKFIHEKNRTIKPVPSSTWAKFKKLTWDPKTPDLIQTPLADVKIECSKAITPEIRLKTMASILEDKMEKGTAMLKMQSRSSHCEIMKSFRTLGQQREPDVLRTSFDQSQTCSVPFGQSRKQINEDFGRFTPNLEERKPEAKSKFKPFDIPVQKTYDPFDVIRKEPKRVVKMPPEKVEYDRTHGLGKAAGQQKKSFLDASSNHEVCLISKPAVQPNKHPSNREYDFNKHFNKPPLYEFTVHKVGRFDLPSQTDIVRKKSWGSPVGQKTAPASLHPEVCIPDRKQPKDVQCKFSNEKKFEKLKENFNARTNSLGFEMGQLWDNPIEFRHTQSNMEVPLFKPGSSKFEQFNLKPLSQWGGLKSDVENGFKAPTGGFESQSNSLQTEGNFRFLEPRAACQSTWTEQRRTSGDRNLAYKMLQLAEANSNPELVKEVPSPRTPKLAIDTNLLSFSETKPMPNSSDMDESLPKLHSSTSQRKTKEVPNNLVPKPRTIVHNQSQPKPKKNSPKNPYLKKELKKTRKDNVESMTPGSKVDNPGTSLRSVVEARLLKEKGNSLFRTHTGEGVKKPATKSVLPERKPQPPLLKTEKKTSKKPKISENKVQLLEIEAPAVKPSVLTEGSEGKYENSVDNFAKSSLRDAVEARLSEVKNDSSISYPDRSIDAVAKPILPETSILKNSPAEDTFETTEETFNKTQKDSMAIFFDAVETSLRSPTEQTELKNDSSTPSKDTHANLTKGLEPNKSAINSLKASPETTKRESKVLKESKKTDLKLKKDADPLKPSKKLKNINVDSKGKVEKFHPKFPISQSLLQNPVEVFEAKVDSIFQTYGTVVSPLKSPINPLKTKPGKIQQKELKPLSKDTRDSSLKLRNGGNEVIRKVKPGSRKCEKGKPDNQISVPFDQIENQKQPNIKKDNPNDQGPKKAGFTNSATVNLLSDAFQLRKGMWPGPKFGNNPENPESLPQTLTSKREELPEPKFEKSSKLHGKAPKTSPKVKPTSFGISKDVQRTKGLKKRNMDSQSELAEKAIEKSITQEHLLQENMLRNPTIIGHEMETRRLTELATENVLHMLQTEIATISPKGGAKKVAKPIGTVPASEEPTNKITKNKYFNITSDVQKPRSVPKDKLLDVNPLWKHRIPVRQRPKTHQEDFHYSKTPTEQSKSSTDIFHKNQEHKNEENLMPMKPAVKTMERNTLRQEIQYDQDTSGRPKSVPPSEGSKYDTIRRTVSGPTTYGTFGRLQAGQDRKDQVTIGCSSNCQGTQPCRPYSTQKLCEISKSVDNPFQKGPFANMLTRHFLPGNKGRMPAIVGYDDAHTPIWGPPGAAFNVMGYKNNGNPIYGPGGPGGPPPPRRIRAFSRSGQPLLEPTESERYKATLIGTCHYDNSPIVGHMDLRPGMINVGKQDVGNKSAAPKYDAIVSSKPKNNTSDNICEGIDERRIYDFLGPYGVINGKHGRGGRYGTGGKRNPYPLSTKVGLCYPVCRYHDGVGCKPRVEKCPKRMGWKWKMKEWSSCSSLKVPKYYKYPGAIMPIVAKRIRRQRRLQGLLVNPERLLRVASEHSTFTYTSSDIDSGA